MNLPPAASRPQPSMPPESFRAVRMALDDLCQFAADIFRNLFRGDLLLCQFPGISHMKINKYLAIAVAHKDMQKPIILHDPNIQRRRDYTKYVAVTDLYRGPSPIPID